MDEHEPDERDDLEDTGDETRDLSESARRARLRRIAAEAREAMEVINQQPDDDPDDPDDPDDEAPEAENDSTLGALSLYGRQMREVVAPFSKYDLGIGTKSYAKTASGMTFQPVVSQIASTMASLSINPDSAAALMLRELGAMSESVAKMTSPLMPGTVGSVVESLRDVYANPAYQDLITNATKTRFMAGALRTLAAHTSIRTKSLVDSEGTVGALQHAIAEAAELRRQMADPYSYFQDVEDDEDTEPKSALQRMIDTVSERERLSDEAVQRILRGEDDDLRSEAKSVYEQMLSDIAAAQELQDDLRNVTENLDADAISDLTQFTLEDGAFEARASFYERVEQAAPDDLDEFERIVREAWQDEELDDLEDDEADDTLDLTPREALVALFLAQRPDVSSNPDLHKRIRRYAAGSGVFLYAYLRVFQPGFFIFLGMLLEVLGFTALILSTTDQVVAKGKKPGDPEVEND